MFQWDDLRFFLALVRDPNASKAAQKLRVNQSTVSRRLKALEDELGRPLFDRTPKGLVLKPEGELLLPMAEEMEKAAFAIDRAFAQQEDLPEGVVRVATVEEIASRFLVPAVPEFRKLYPGIELVFLTSPRTVSLARREADVSLRLARPKEGDLHGRRVGGFRYGVYASRAYLSTIPEEWIDEPEKLSWIVLDPLPPHLLEGEWIRRRLPNLKPVLKCSGVKTMVASAQAGLGVVILPRPSAWFYPDLERLPIDTIGLERELWLVVHRDMRKLPAIQVVMEWLERAIQPENAPVRPKPAAHGFPLI